jgi:hypothetical protein
MDFMRVGVFLSFLFLMAVLWVVRMFAVGMRRRRELDVLSRFHDKLLDRFSTGEELKELMESEAADKLYQSITGARGGAHQRILLALQAGLVLSLLGLALAFAGWFLPDDEGLFTVFGVLFVGLGLGFLLASGVTYRLSKKWGLLNPTDGLPQRDH